MTESYGLIDPQAGGNFLNNLFKLPSKSGGAKKKGAKKAAPTYKKTSKTVTGRDGVARTVYVKGDKMYVKKKNSVGKFVYREVKRK